jgi:hypothetical protein
MDDKIKWEDYLNEEYIKQCEKELIEKEEIITETEKERNKREYIEKQKELGILDNGKEKIFIFLTKKRK